MQKSHQAFRSIGEVAQLIGVATHVLRYWETQFPQLSPVKRADGRRYYRPGDVRLAAGLVAVLREDGMTIRGARRLIAQDKGAALRARGAARLGPDWQEGAAARAASASAALAQRPAPSADIPAPQTKAGTSAPPPAGGESDWLGRLARTAARLRARGGPLPEAARDLAAALRAGRAGGG